MKNLILINVFIFVVNILTLIYNLVLIKNAVKSRDKYRKIINTQKIEIDFLNKELEDMEREEIFEGKLLICK